MRFVVAFFPLLTWAVWVGIITLFPFDFGTSAGRGFFELSLARQIDDIPLNVLLFVPLGAWLHAHGRSRSLGLKSFLILACVTGSLGSAFVEYLQLFLPSRFPSVVDIVSNTSGALVGVYLHRRWADSVDDAVTRLRNWTSGAYVVSVMAVVVLSALVISGVLQAQTRLSNWDLSYPLLVGNEQTGGRPWRGRVYSIELTDAATPPDSLQGFADGGSIVMSGNKIANFDLSGAEPYRDTTGHLSNLTRAGDSPSHSTQVAPISKYSWLRTEDAATSSARRLRESNAFSLRVRCATEDVSQDGPARIVSNSIDAGHRNLTLGQAGRYLALRVRSPHTGENAFNPEMRIPNVFSDSGLRDILVTYDGAAAWVAVAKSGQVQHFELSPGSSLVAATSSQVFPHELQRYKLAYLACLFLPPGMLVYSLCRGWRNQLAWSGFWVVGFTLLLEATLVHVSGRPFESKSVATTAAIGTLVFLAALLIPWGLTRAPRVSG